MIRLVLTVLALLPLALGEPALAQSKCTSAQWKTATKNAADVGKCESKGAKKGLEADPACVAKGEAKLDKGMAKAANKGDCIAEVDETAVQAIVDQFVEELRRELDPPPAVCCDAGGGGGSSCFMLADAATCTDNGGTLGAAGTSCDGSGSCVDPPLVAQGCCTDFTTGPIAVLCTIGTFDEGECTGAGGSFTGNAVCDLTGRCLMPTP